MLKTWLAHPLTRGLNIDDPHTTNLRRQILHEKKFLYQLYQEWYTDIAACLPEGQSPVVELGSGAGFLSEFVSGLITSEIFGCSNIRVVLNGLKLPFINDSLRAVVMTDVLHHIPHPRQFFREAMRCIQPGGVIAMIEPWVTPWSRLVYTRLHHEPFCPESKEWDILASGPLSGANGALPWIIFRRDRTRFEQEFPQWQIEQIKPMMPFRYLVSGGISLRELMPPWSFQWWSDLENALSLQMEELAMFALIVLRHK